jgi:hypothetical protein
MGMQTRTIAALAWESRHQTLCSNSSSSTLLVLPAAPALWLQQFAWQTASTPQLALLLAVHAQTACM